MKASDFAQLVPDSCSAVLDAMYFTTVLETSNSATLPKDSSMDAQDLAFSLRFAGDISGIFGLHLGPATASALASNFLGDNESDLLPADVAEVVGELANMFCGSILSRIEGVGTFDLTHPMPLLALPSLSSEDAIVSTLDTDSGAITTWVIVEGTA
jgi:CheY-specific phosphatase CheX